ncbi:tyrosine-type recombinase/integrase, partial [Thermodesulfobacteriota bacterium]
CGTDLDKEKKSKKVKYHLVYRVNGKQKWESVSTFDDLNGYSIEDARKAHSKRVVQKAENTILDIKQDFKMTFKQLSDWYLELEKVKSLTSFPTIKIYINKFLNEFGNRIVGTIKLADLENLQEKRKREGLRPKTIDDEICYTKTMIIKAFDNDKVGGDVLKAFKKVKLLLKGNANARDRVLTKDEYEAILSHSKGHLKDILIMAYWTGMRKGEILKLTWDKVDLIGRMIRLEAKDTKEGKAKNIPISDEVYKVLTRDNRHIRRVDSEKHILLYRGKPIYRFQTALMNACDNAGILWGRDKKGGFVFHDTRHGFVTDMRKAGVDKSVRMSITGHAIKDMDDRYNKVDEEDQHQAIKKLEAYRLNVRQNVRYEGFQLAEKL